MRPTFEPWTLYDEWQAAHRPGRLPEPIREMYAAHGRAPGKHCQTCRHLVRLSNGKRRRWLKCRKYPYTDRTASTDWKAGFLACGLHAQDPNDKPDL